MDWDRTRRFDDHRGGESYRPGTSRAYSRRSRSPPRIRSPPSRLVADTWVPSNGRVYGRARSRSPPPFRRRTSRSPPAYKRETAQGSYPKPYTSRKFSPRRDVRPRSPLLPSRRPRSPYTEDHARDTSWTPSTSTPRHPRDSSPVTRDSGYYRNNRRLPSVGRYTSSGSPARHGPLSNDHQRPTATLRARSPFYSGRKEPATERFLGPRRRSQSPNDLLSKRPSAHSSRPSSRRSSPLHDKAISAAPRADRSRSPPATHFNRRLSRDQGVSSSQSDRSSIAKGKLGTPETRSKSPTAEQACLKTAPNQHSIGSSRSAEMPERGTNNKPLYPSNAPSQPKAFSHNGHRSPPTALPHGPKTLPSHPRASNISILSAPTRPRGSPGFKENVWTGTPGRRGPPPAGAPGAPTAPRSTQSTASGVEAQRARSYRSESACGAPPSSQRYPKHLVGLSTIIPGGRLLASEIDAAIERRLSQLDADKDRLFEQNAESQKLKRIGLRDWDRLDRESSICALKSELAESHLQCITDTEGTLGRAMF
ncbi:hypothetical protein BJY01DRAFT_226156 [Aspergillus pseudoustus]|uniref:Serine/arginine repetitive matrix protein 1 n=1 Tax=Aspergillus pseudoustus TaxID=1810923 RepID=A0ABR4IWU3_9EURO